VGVFSHYFEIPIDQMNHHDPKGFEVTSAVVLVFPFMIKSTFIHTLPRACVLYIQILCTIMEFVLFFSLSAASGCLVICHFSVYLCNVRVIYPRGIYKHKQ